MARQDILTEIGMLLGRTFAVGLVGGISAIILSIFLGIGGTGLWAGIIVSLIVLGLTIYVAKMAKLSRIALFDFVVFLTALTLVGTLVTAIFPSAAGYLLSFKDALTVSGLLYVFLYASIGTIAFDYIRKMV